MGLRFAARSVRSRWTSYESSRIDTFLSSPTLMSNALVVSGFSDEFYVLNSADGSELAMIKHGGISVDSPTVLPGLMVFGTSIYHQEKDSPDSYFYATMFLVRYE